MTLLKATIGLISLAFIGTTSAYSLDERGARTKAREFFQRVDPSITAEELAGLVATCKGGETSRLRWVLATGRRTVSIDDATGEPFLYTDGVLENRAMGGPGSERVPARGAPHDRERSERVGRLRQVLVSLNWNPGPDVSYESFPEADVDGQVKRTIAYFEFADSPGGYPTGRGGNTALVGVDSLTGEIIQLERHFGFTYRPPSVNVDRQRAIALATNELGSSPDPERFKGPEYQELLPSFDLSVSGRQMRESKTLPLVYRVGDGRDWLLISAEDGEILGRYTSRGAEDGPSDPKREANAEPSKPIQLPMIVAIGAGIIAVFYLAFRKPAS